MIQFQKLFTAKQISELDKISIQKQKITSEELMEKAGKALFKKMKKNLNKKNPIVIFCGLGNNGGDGLVLTRLFADKHYNVSCVIVPFSTNTSPDFDKNLHKIMSKNIPVHIFDKHFSIEKNTIIIDAVFGSGLSRSASGIAKKAIDYINSLNLNVLSVDVPSGLYIDKSNADTDSIVKATKVYTIQLPKKSFYYPENALYVPKFKRVSIGLDIKTIKKMKTDFYAYNFNFDKFIKSRNDYQHKNYFGKLFVVGGSYGMIGAAMLTAKSALRVGAGSVIAYVPKCGYVPFQSAIPEVMVQTDQYKKIITNIPFLNETIAIGPGLGNHKNTEKAVLNLIKKRNKPLIIDADAISILGKHKDFLNFIPKQSILTPHYGEFKSLVGKWHNDDERIEKAKKFAKKYQIILVLKGAFTLITNGKEVFFSKFVNSALSTAGSGDVLTGIIAGIKVQGYSSLHSALIGVYLHAYSAKNYVKQHNKFSMLAGDIIHPKYLNFSKKMS